MRLADCVRCGRGVGRKNTELCCRCRAADCEAAARAQCSTCRRVRRLVDDTGRCVTCSRVCVDCGQVVRSKSSDRCRPCVRRSEIAEAKQPCPRCGRDGLIREATGWCGNCSKPRPELAPPRPCVQCDRLVRRLSLGLCGRCWQRNPDRVRNQTDRLAETLTDPPWWLGEFADFATERHCVGRASRMISDLGHLLNDDVSNHPQALLERSRTPGRSAGTLARTLEAFFVERDLAFGLDQSARLAAGRRERRVDATPEPFRAVVASFCEHLVRSRERARRAGTKPRADSTIDIALATARDLAHFLIDERGKDDWAVVQAADIEAFLNAKPNNRRRLFHSVRGFFRWARRNKIVLADPTRTLSISPASGFSGNTLSIDEQRRLFRRWTTDPTVHPHEAAVGLLALLHAFTNGELRRLQLSDLDRSTSSLAVGGRPHRVPLDPATLAAVDACVEHRAGRDTQNPHLFVTKITRTRDTSASSPYVTHVLDPVGVAIKQLRCTRLADLVISLDPKIVGDALGMSNEGLLRYLADHVDPSRLTRPSEAMDRHGAART